MNFSEVLSRAWQIVWKHKVLWIFGILASCGQQSASSGTRFDFPAPSNWSSSQEMDLSQLPPEFYSFMLSLVFVGLIVAVIAYLLGVVGRLGLIQGVAMSEAGEENISFGQLIERSKPFLGRALLLNLLVLLAVMAAIFVFAMGFIAVAAVTLGIGLLCLLPLLCLLIPVGWFVAIIIEQANIALVLEDLKVTDALGRGWSVVRENVGPMLVLGLILIIGGAFLSMILTMPVLAILFPLLTAAMDGTREALIGGGMLSLVCMVLYLPVLLVISGIVQAFVKSTWTLAFMRLTSASTPKPEALPEAV